MLFFFFPFQEMIIDQVQGEPVPRYLIYDIVTFEVSGGWPVRRLTTYKLVINVALNLESHNQVTILLIARQLSCHDMYTIVTWAPSQYKDRLI